MAQSVASNDIFGFSQLLSTLPAADRDALSQVPEAEDEPKHDLMRKRTNSRNTTSQSSRWAIPRAKNHLSDDTLIELFELLTERFIESCDSDGSSLVKWRWMLYQGQVCCRWRTSHMHTLAALLPHMAPLTLPPVRLDFDYHCEAWEAVRPYAARMSDFRIWVVSHAGTFALCQEGNTSEDRSKLESLQIEIVVDPSRGEIKGEWRDEDLPRLQYLNVTPPGYIYGTTSVASLEESS